MSNEVHLNGKDATDLCRSLLHTIQHVRWLGVNGIGIWPRNFLRFVSAKGKMFSPCRYWLKDGESTTTQ